MTSRAIRTGLVWTVMILAVALSSAIADTITTKTGETIHGTVKQFRANHHSTANSAFVVVVEGEERVIPAQEVETVTFGPRPPAAAMTAGRPSPTRTSARQSPRLSDEPQADSAPHWLTTSSRKRHNERCRYYKTTNGRPCGHEEGTPCKICGG
jgi:hypothetical protein